MWHIHKNTSYAELIASLPFVLFFTEWYLTAFTAQNWSYKDRLLLSVVLIWLIQAGIMVNFYDQLLNV